jgi:hypothetical protein
MTIHPICTIDARPIAARQNAACGVPRNPRSAPTAMVAVAAIAQPQQAESAEGEHRDRDAVLAGGEDLVHDPTGERADQEPAERESAERERFQPQDDNERGRPDRRPAGGSHRSTVARRVGARR